MWRAECLPRRSVTVKGDEEPASTIALANFPLAHKMRASRRHRDFWPSELDTGNFPGWQFLLVAILEHNCGRSLQVNAGNFGRGEALMVAIFEDNNDAVLRGGRKWPRRRSYDAQQQDCKHSSDSYETEHDFLRNE
jgi:hypothetical protein